MIPDVYEQQQYGYNQASMYQRQMVYAHTVSRKKSKVISIKYPASKQKYSLSQACYVNLLFRGLCNNVSLMLLACR